ncbi:DUT, partial [Symbiodinium necroappetens]
MEVLPPAEDHSRLASGEDGLPEVEELLMLRPQNCRVDIAALTSLIGCIPPESLHRGHPRRHHENYRHQHHQHHQHHHHHH